MVIMDVKIIDNCCSPVQLDFFKYVACNSGSWHWRYPMSASSTLLGTDINVLTPFKDEVTIDQKFPKIDIVWNGIKDQFLTGLAMNVLLQIWEASGRDLFIPEMHFCGIAMKDKHREDNTHRDYEPNLGMIKITGLLNSDWDESWGGGMEWNGTYHYAKPTSFYVFDGAQPHRCSEIFTDKKRFMLDYTVFRDQRSLNNSPTKQRWGSENWI